MYVDLPLVTKVVPPFNQAGILNGILNVNESVQLADAAAERGLAFEKSAAAQMAAAA